MLTAIAWAGVITAIVLACRWAAFFITDAMEDIEE